MSDVTIFHNPACGTSRNTLALIRHAGLEPTVIELNLETVKQLRTIGFRAVYGDAARRETLEEGGVATAASLIVSSSGVKEGSEVIRIAREINPLIRVLKKQLSNNGYNT